MQGLVNALQAQLPETSLSVRQQQWDNYFALIYGAANTLAISAGDEQTLGKLAVSFNIDMATITAHVQALRRALA